MVILRDGNDLNPYQNVCKFMSEFSFCEKEEHHPEMLQNFSVLMLENTNQIENNKYKIINTKY